MFRPELPIEKGPWAVGATKQLVSNQRSLVVLDNVPLQTRSGREPAPRLPVSPLQVGVNGYPLLAVRMEVVVHPPITVLTRREEAFRKSGISHTTLEAKTLGES